jgi:hypothetical protein
MIRKVGTGVDSKFGDTLLEKQGESRRLKLLGMQLKPLHLCGILPPGNIATSAWKSFLYNIFTTLALFWFVPHTVTQIMALYEHRNKFEMVTALVFQIALFIHTGTVAAYFVFHRKQLARLLESLETHFVPHIEKVGSAPKHMPIIREASKQASILIWTLLVVCWVVLFAWGFLPMIVRYFDVLTSTDQEIDASLDSKDEYLKYFGLIMWLPPNVDKFPVYELVYVFDSVAAYVVDSNLTGSNTIFFIFMFNISTHFKILTSCIEDIDEMFSQTNEAMKEGFPDTKTENVKYEFHTTSLRDEIFGPLLPEALSSGRQKVRHKDGSATRSGFRGKFADKRGDDIKKTSGEETSDCMENIFKSNKSGEQASSDALRDEQIYRYLTECIKYHQALLE